MSVSQLCQVKKQRVPGVAKHAVEVGGAAIAEGERRRAFLESFYVKQLTFPLPQNSHINSSTSHLVTPALARRARGHPVVAAVTRPDQFGRPVPEPPFVRIPEGVLHEARVNGFLFLVTSANGVVRVNVRVPEHVRFRVQRKRSFAYCFVSHDSNQRRRPAVHLRQGHEVREGYDIFFVDGLEATLKKLV